MKRTILSLSIIAVTAISVNAQSIGPSVLNATGGSGRIGSNTYDYAVGDLTDGVTLSAPTLVVTPGVLQPVLVPAAVHTPSSVINGLSVYPSPVTFTLYLEPHFGTRGKMQYNLYDAAGKLVLTKEVVLTTGNERQEAGVASLAIGQYTLQVEWQNGWNGDKQVAAYKIQKIQ